MIIETERLMLRPFTMDDFDIIYRLYSDEEILRYMPNDIMDEEQARKHLATEMTRAMIDYAFDTIGVHRVSALCNPDNIASWKAMENCGMRREAHYRKKVRYVRHGVPSWEDELEYAILREERQ
jgi:RimJ/RimL family protein N-acetyltransferase